MLFKNQNLLLKIPYQTAPKFFTYLGLNIAENKHKPRKKNEEKDLSNPSTSLENKHQETQLTQKSLIFPPPPHHDYIQFSTKTNLAKRPTSHLLFTLNPIECGGMTLLHRRWIAEGGKRKTSPFVHEIIKVFFFFKKK